MSYLLPTIADQITLNAIKADVHPLIPIISGSFAYYFLNNAIKEHGLARANATWNIHSTIFAFVSGYYFWQESITPKQFAGIGLGVLSLHLMN